MLGRNVRCPPTLTPRRNTTRAIRDKEIGYLLHYVLPPEPQPDQPRRYSLQQWHRAEHAHDQRRLHASASAQHPLDDIVLDHELRPLRDAGRQLAPLLHASQRLDRDRRAAPELGDQNVRGGDGVLDREIDPHSGNRRHRVRGVADTEETGPVPFAQAVDLNREQLDVSPIPQLRNPISQERIHLHDITPECVDTATLDLRESAFLDHQPALPVIAAIQHHEDPPEIDAAEHLLRIAGLSGQPHPEHVHGRAEVDRLKPGRRAHAGVPPIGGHDQIRPQRPFSLRRLHAHARDAITFEEESRHLRLHLQAERRVGTRPLGQEIEEVPLRHEHQELAVHGQVTEIRQSEGGFSDLTGECAHLRVRQLQELVDDAELVENLERGRMHRVAAKVAEKVRVLFEHRDADARASEQQPEHHAGGTTAGDDTGSFHHGARIVKSSCRSRSGSASKSIATIFPPAVVNRNTTRGRSPAIHTSPAAPFTSAGCAAWARPLKVSATACAPRTSAAAPIRTAAGSARSTTSGSSTASSAAKSPPREAARNASTSSRWRVRSAGPAVAPCTRRRARLASCRAAAGVRPTMGAISSNGRSNMSCSTNATRSGGASVSSTTSSAGPTASARSASRSGSVESSRPTTGPSTSASSGSSRRAVRERSMSKHSRATIVVSHPPRFSTSLGSERLTRSQASCTASSASLPEPSIR